MIEVREYRGNLFYVDERDDYFIVMLPDGTSILLNSYVDVDEFIMDYRGECCDEDPWLEFKG